MKAFLANLTVVVGCVAIVLGCVLLAVLASSCVRKDPTTFPESPVRTLPLTVTADADVRGSSLDAAIGFWNRELGRTVFKRAVSGSIRISNCGPVDHGSSALLSRTVCVNGGGDDHGTYLILAHELGHMLGLMDDPPGMRSVMGIDAADWDPLDGRMFGILFLTDRDRAALRLLLR